MSSKVKESRVCGFAVIFTAYLISAAVGVTVYYFLPLFWHFALRLLVADGAATVVVFVFSVLLQNASVYDPYWSVQPILILAAFFMNSGFSVSGLFPLIAVCLWGVRLTANWAYTFKNLNVQDWRYTMLKEKTGVFYPLVNMFGIHMFPTLVVYACVLPAVFTVVLKPQFNAVSVVFFCVSLLATVLQFVSDIQMQIYRLSRKTPFISGGLWKYSRHPNYLGEILMWWGVGGYAAVLMPDKWYLLVGALINTLMFFTVSIPMADGRQSEKEGFNEYKAKTRALLPIPKRARIK